MIVFGSDETGQVDDGFVNERRQISIAIDFSNSDSQGAMDEDWAQSEEAVSRLHLTHARPFAGCFRKDRQ